MLFHSQYKECPKSLNSKVYLHLNFPEKSAQESGERQSDLRSAVRER